ncbi:MAG: sulfur carrier protein ThiS [Chloroflexi bacterium]|nr:sulfur carrier protein ThiS [Chloroflexota bacterium]
MITVRVNGKDAELAEDQSVEQYLESKGLAGRSLAVAVNGIVLRREELPGTLLSDGDRVEIVRPVGGG